MIEIHNFISQYYSMAIAEVFALIELDLVMHNLLSLLFHDTWTNGATCLLHLDDVAASLHSIQPIGMLHMDLYPLMILWDLFFNFNIFLNRLNFTWNFIIYLHWWRLMNCAVKPISLNFRRFCVRINCLIFLLNSSLA